MYLARVPDLVVETPEGSALRYEIAGAGTRTVAAAVDLLLWATVMLSAAALFLVTGLGASVVLVASAVIVSLVLYSFLFAALWSGRTPGKALVGIRVLDEDGFPASSGQHFLRALFFPLEAVALAFPVPLAVALVAATPRRQRLGDLVAGTLVLREPRVEESAEPYPNETWSGLEKLLLALVPAHAARFDGEDLEFLRALLARREIDARARARLMRSAARHYAERLDLAGSDFDAPRARAFLRELFLFLREMRASRAGGGRPAPTTRPEVAAGRGSARARGSTRR